MCSYEPPSAEWKKKHQDVCYFVDHSNTHIEFIAGHAMRPKRLHLTHSLVHSLGLEEFMDIRTAQPATEDDFLLFHPPEYVHFLKSTRFITQGTGAEERGRGDEQPSTIASAVSENVDPCASVMTREYTHSNSKGISEDCPLFPGLWDVVRSYCGASIACANAILHGDCRIAINWSGGLHHADARRANGFCYANDIVLCIRKLLKRFDRILYVDIDVHHGDGVEKAFERSTRVLTVSLHQFGQDFYPGTGELCDVGVGQGRGFAVNVGMPAGTTAKTYTKMFDYVMTDVVRAFDPNAVVVQCGADSVYGDLIGSFRLSTATHGSCVRKLVGLGLPTVLLGGGGYNVFHTARCWAVDTAAALGRDGLLLPVELPHCDPYYTYYRQENPQVRPSLHVFPPPIDDGSVGNTASTGCVGGNIIHDREHDESFGAAQLFSLCVSSVSMQMKRVEMLRANYWKQLGPLRPKEAAKREEEKAHRHNAAVGGGKEVTEAEKRLNDQGVSSTSSCDGICTEVEGAADERTQLEREDVGVKEEEQEMQLVTEASLVELKKQIKRKEPLKKRDRSS